MIFGRRMQPSAKDPPGRRHNDRCSRAGLAGFARSGEVYEGFVRVNDSGGSTSRAVAAPQGLSALSPGASTRRCIALTRQTSLSDTLASAQRCNGRYGHSGSAPCPHVDVAGQSASSPPAAMRRWTSNVTLAGITAEVLSDYLPAVPNRTHAYGQKLRLAWQ